MTESTKSFRELEEAAAREKVAACPLTAFEGKKQAERKEGDPASSSGAAPSGKPERKHQPFEYDLEY